MLHELNTEQVHRVIWLELGLSRLSGIDQRVEYMFQTFFAKQNTLLSPFNSSTHTLSMVSSS